jgi:hypothetical protein
MNNVKITFSLLLLTISLALVSIGHVLIGMYSLLAAFPYFFYTLAIYDRPPKEILKVHHVSAEEHYRKERDKKMERHAKRIANLPKNKYRANGKNKQRLSYYSGASISSVALISSIDAPAIADDDENSFTNHYDMQQDFGTQISEFEQVDDVHINPATGELMIGGIGGVDTNGNTYGTDLHHDDFDTTSATSFDSTFDDSFSSSFDDSFDLSNDDSFDSSFDDSI